MYKHIFDIIILINCIKILFNTEGKGHVVVILHLLIVPFENDVFNSIKVLSHR